MNESDQGDPLAALLADDTRTIDRNRLAVFLAPYVQFDRTTKDIGLLDAFNTIIPNDAKIEVILMASKARFLILDTPEGLSPSELIKMDIMPEGSVKSSLKKLYDGRKIKKEPSSGKYFIPNYRIDDVTERLTVKVS